MPLTAAVSFLFSSLGLPRMHQRTMSDIWLLVTVFALGSMLIYHLPNQIAIMFILCGTLIALVALLRQPILSIMDPKLSNVIDMPESAPYAACVAKCKNPTEVNMLHAGWKIGHEMGLRKAREREARVHIHHGQPPICGPVDYPLRRKKRLGRPSLSQIDCWLTKDAITIAGSHTDQLRYKAENVSPASLRFGRQDLGSGLEALGLDSVLAPVESVVRC